LYKIKIDANLLKNEQEKVKNELVETHIEKKKLWKTR
jgi:hypothetical protein